MEEKNMNEVVKPTYEELEAAYNARTNQVRDLYEQLQQANANNLVLRLEFLFKVLENKDMFTADFVNRCVSDITELLTIPEQENSEE